MFDASAAVPSDDCPRFVGAGGRKKPAKIWTPTLFEGGLPAPGAGLINPLQYHPQTGGMLKRLHKGVGCEMWVCERLEDCAECHNADRPHRALNIDGYGAPPPAFRSQRSK